MNAEQLRRIMPAATDHVADRAAAHADMLTAAMSEFSISTPRRQAAFIANVAEETMQLHYMREIASGAAYEPAIAGQPPNPRAIALGNTEVGDGPRFKGGGYPMLSGRANYLACGKALGVDLIANPSLIEAPYCAARAGGWFWQTHGLNELADADKFISVIHRLNGGFNGGDERVAFWLRARSELGVR